MKMLADTSALLAIHAKVDHNHAKSRAFLRDNPSARFVLTEVILAELVARLRPRVGAAEAAAVGRSYLVSARFELIFVDVPVISRSLARLEQFADKRLSLTDCVSFEVMDRLGLKTAFTFDRDFRDCGYEMVP